MPPIKPLETPSFKVADLQARLDRLSNAIRSVRAADGSVDVGKLRAAVASTGDGGAARALGVLDQYLTPAPLKDVDVLPSPGVDQLLALILHGKEQVQQFDLNGDGAIDWGEGRPADRAAPQAFLTDRLAAAVLGQARTPASVAEKNTLQSTVQAVRNRSRLDRNIVEYAQASAQSALAAEAIGWAYRARAASSTSLPTVSDLYAQMSGELMRAESDPRSHLPVIGPWFAGSHHLDDAEVMKLLGTTDLEAFVAEKKTGIAAQLGMPYEQWLRGRDLPDADKLDDAAFAQLTRNTDVGD